MNVSQAPRQEEFTDLRVLEEIERDPNLSQRELSRRVGVSLGFTNLILQRMVRKAWIKISTVPGRRMLYAVTLRGMAEKIRKTCDFARLSFRYYSNLKRSLTDRIRAAGQSRPRVASYAAGELSQIVAEAAREGGGRYLGPVENLEELAAVEILVLLGPANRPQRDEWQHRGIALIDLS